MRKLVVWILNIGIAVLCVLSIVGYAFGPFWSISTGVNLPKEKVQEIFESQQGDVEGSDELDYESIVGEGIDLNITFSIPANLVFNAMDGGENAITGIVESSVDNVYDEFIGIFKDVSRKLVKELTRSAIKKELKKEMLNHLLNEGNELNDQEVWDKLQNAGITDEYLVDEINGIIDLIYSGHTTVDAVNEKLLDTVDNVYDKLKNSGDEDFANVELDQETKDQVVKSFSSVLKTVADDNGDIDASKIVENLLLDMFKSMNDGGGETEEEAEIEPASVILMAAENSAEGTEGGDGDRDVNEEIKTEIKNFLIEQLGDVAEIVGYVLLAMFGLYALSSLAWLYILIKLLVKLLRIRKSEPTVKLKAPIILGWLPFLILVLLPTVALKIVVGQFLTDLPIDLTMTFASVGGTIAFVSAIICFAISIFYMVIRRKNKKERKAKQAANN